MKTSKLLFLGMLICVLCTTQTLGQAPSVACGVAAYHNGTSSLALVALEGDVLDYVVDVTNGPYRIENGVVTLTLPDGTTVVTLDTNLSLPAGGTAQYPVTFPPVPANQEYTIDSGDIGNNSAPANSVQALSQCVADAIIEEPDTSVQVTGTGQWPTLVIDPDIEIRKSAEPAGICEEVETEITYTYEVENTGDVDLVIVSVEDDTCESVDGVDETPADGYNDGDTDLDYELDVGEIWLFECTTLISTTTTNTVIVTAEDVELGREVTAEAEATVTAGGPSCRIVQPETPDCPSSDNTIEVEVAGGTPGYTYSWEITEGDTGWEITGGEDSSIVTYDAGEGGCATFLVTITDAEDCETTCEIEVCCTVQGLCYGDETAWAFGGGYANENWDYAKGRNWGWTNGPLPAGTYEWDLYAGAGRNILSNGEVVGTVTVEYDGDCVDVTYEVDEGYYLGEAHLWIGNTPLPEVTKGKKTVATDAPGQFPYSVDYGFDPEDSDTWEIEWAIEVCDFEGDIYVAAHSVVWMEVECPPEICDNDIDDDKDGLIDCEDPDCTEDPDCVSPS